MIQQLNDSTSEAIQQLNDSTKMFNLYLKLGFEHLLDLAAYDHLLFVIALTVVYQLAEWKKLLILVTAFTIGHSITLALAVLDVIQFPATIIEWLIPITILLTAAYNLWTLSATDGDSATQKTDLNIKYFAALFFGLIHGMGFSNFLKSALMPGEEQQIVWQLLAFNLGIEMGQLVIVGMVVLINFLVLNFLKVNKQNWIKIVNTLVMVFCIWIIGGLLE